MQDPKAVAVKTFVIYAEDRPGVLNRVDSLFRRRGLNIVSLNVGRTHEEGISRMTLVVETTTESSSRIEANLYKLVNVLSVEDITDKPLVCPDLALIKLHIGPEQRTELLQLCEVFRARVVDLGSTEAIVEIAGPPDKIDAVIGVLAPFRIAEMVQTGRLAMTRGRKGEAACMARPSAQLRSIND